MKRVYSAEVLPLVHHAKNVLAVAGIDSEIRNENLGSLAGEIPFMAVFPELWVADRDEARANAIIEAEILNVPPAGGRPWECTACSAVNEAQFAVCWQCSEPAFD